MILCALGLAGCTGTGGSASSIGEVYNPDGTPISSGNSGSGTGGGNATGSSGRPGATEAASGSVSQTVSVELLHEMANSGNADGISSRFPNGEDESSKTFFLNLSPEDFGVPADGYMILSLDSDGFAPGYGLFWEDTQFVSADGMFFFSDIPMMRVGSHVTVNIRCYAADGTLIRSGYSSGTAKVDGIPLTIDVIGSPEISVENGTANGNMAVQGGVQYEVLEYTDAAAVSMTAVNGNEGATMVVQVNGTTVATTTASSMSAPLSDGFNAIVATVSKGNNEPIEMKRNVYVVKALTAPTISFNGDHYPAQDTATYEMWKYSYGSHENLELTVTNEYAATGDNAATGNSTMTVTVTGITSFTSASGDVSDRVLNDGLQTIAVTLTKPYCTPIEITKTIYAHIKKVKLTQWEQKIYIGNNTKLSGSVYLGGRLMRSFSDTSWAKNTTEHFNVREGYDSNFYMTEKTDTLRYYTSGFKAGSDDLSDADSTYSLSDIKTDNTGRGHWYVYAYGSGGSTQHEIYLSINDDE